MATSKILKVKNIYATVKYVCKNEKTDHQQLISSHKCDVPFAARQFNEITQDRRMRSSKPFSVENWMIIQAFQPGEVSPEKAHEIGMEFAKRYLGEGHQFLVATHIDQGHVHNHIVFNATNFETYKSFDSRNKHIITDLRMENDKICKEYGLSVITEPKGKGISQREYYARKNQRSYKAQLEKLIDKAIEKAEDYQDFLTIMDRNTEVRFGNPLAFKLPDQERFTKITKLGIDYSENSIKFRIENKALKIEKMPDAKTLITKSSQQPGKENEGLSRWETQQNIDTLAKMSHAMHEQKITSQEYLQRQKSGISRINDLGKKIETIDKTISFHETYLKQEAIYRSCFPVIQGYKNAEDKQEYKKKHFATFKAYDKAKSIVAEYKNADGKIPNPSTIKSELNDLLAERDTLYTEYQIAKQQLANNQDTSKNQQREQTKNKDRDDL